MARDFRPKAARAGGKSSTQAAQAKEPSQRHGSTGAATAQRTAKSANGREGASPSKSRSADHDRGTTSGRAGANDFESGSGADGDEDEDDEDEDDEALLREIRALGGDENDLKLVKTPRGADKADNTDAAPDPTLHNDLMAFVNGLDFKGAEVAAPSLEAASSKVASKPKAAQQQDENARLDLERKQKERAAQRDEKAKNDLRKAEKHARKEQEVAQTRPIVPEAGSDTARIHSSFIFLPTQRWSEAQLPELPAVPSTSSSLAASVSNDVAARLQRRADGLLQSERALYAQQMGSGRNAAPGMLSASDARFISQLLAPGARGGTLSDRIAALALLAQSSPVHNLEAMETLLGMAQKKGREESSRATRALADWLSSGGGLSERKLCYFRDHPSVRHVAALDRQGAGLSKKAQQLIDTHLLLAAFEDRLKRFYFDFLRCLETQSHDTLPFMRKQAVTQIFYLLKDKAEQEQNLLRLLANKLGDSDRSVASKASSHILSLLNVHPNMKAVVTNEVSNLVMQAPGGSHREGKANANMHARYYGLLTLNQTMLTNDDESVARRLITLYFDLFEGVLQEMDRTAGGKEELVSAESNTEKRDKGRWRDGSRGKGKGRPTVKGKGKQGGKGKGAAQQDDPNTVPDADSKIVGAVLAGVRRALPFAKVESAVIEKYMDTLFCITHCSTFNISLQALQLIYQVCQGGGATPSTSSTPSALQDRFYRTLYASMLDPRLLATSKQAMYLNLLFKSMKSDHEDARTKAFVKRLVQLMNNSEPPFICGSLFLLGELFTAKPGLRTLLNDAEDDGEEHFVDARDEQDEDEAEAERNAGGDTTKAFTSPASHGKQEGYDGIKREPRYAGAEMTCLWELVPLLSHFHPSVSLCAAQLLTAQPINTSADLTLHTLSHFLDRFVYRNPKKNAATSKGASLMQPAVHASGDGRVGLETGVVRLKGAGVRKDEFVNDDKFWRKKAADVPADQLFFHKYFNLRRHGDGRDVPASTAEPEENEDEGQASAGERSDSNEAESEAAIGRDALESEAAGDASSEENSEAEREIWKAMKASMPRQQGDEVLDEEDEEDESDLDPALMASSDEDVDEDDDNASESADDGEAGMFEDDEDDLMPFAFGADDDGGSDDDEDNAAAKKRKATHGADDDGEEDADDGKKPKSKSQQRRSEQKKRKTLPTFASADDYAHLL